MKLLITGGTGLVGSAFSKGTKISSKDVNLIKPSDTMEYFIKSKPTHIIHAAGMVGGLIGNMNHKGEFFYKNTMININVLEAARIVGAKKVLSFLSTCVFPDNAKCPLTEDQIHNGDPHNSNYPYAYAKRMLDIQSRAYNEQYGCNFICVVPTNIYGPNDNFELENGHVIPMLIHKCYIAKRDKTDFVIWGSGAPLREFIYSKDIAKLSMWALENYDEREPIIFTTSKEVSIGYVAELIAKYMEFNGNIVYDRTKPDGQFRKHSSNEKLKKYLPDFEYTSLENGIKETVNWFNENYPNVRK
jgi:GDP-L-fucose synthase